MNLVPGGGGVSAGPAGHWAIYMHSSATPPRRASAVSAALRVCVTTRQKSTAVPTIRSSSSGSLHAQIAPDRLVSCRKSLLCGTAKPRFAEDQAKVWMPITTMLRIRSRASRPTPSASKTAWLQARISPALR